MKKIPPKPKSVLLIQVNGLYSSDPQPPSYNGSRHPSAVPNGTHSALPKKPQRAKDVRSGSESGSGQRRKVDMTRAASSTSAAMLDDEFVSLLSFCMHNQNHLRLIVVTDYHIS